MTTALKISDYALVVGEFDQMTCAPNGGFVAIDSARFSCPFGTLHLNQMVASGATGTDGPANGTRIGATSTLVP